MTKEELLDPRTWGAPARVRMRETHVSWVALQGDRAYKVKKPVDLGFLDFRSLEQRRSACDAEVRLNRRLAADIYLGVIGLVRREGGLRRADADAPGVVEYAVEMRRFDEQDTLARRIAADLVAPTQVEALGQLIAAFHRTVPVIAEEGAAQRAKATLTDNLEGLRSPVGSDRSRVAALARFADAFLAERWDELEQRGREGSVREGHGDLRSEHVVLSPTPAVIDCVEFSRDLRCVDVASDLAFLVMDLIHLQRSDLARALVAGYRSAGGDAGDDRLIAFFAMGRAVVRAKVAYLRARQLEGLDADAQVALAKEFLDLAVRMAWRARGRLLVVVCGPAASGKSTLAAAIGAASGLGVLSSDVERKRAAGLEPTQRGGGLLYDARHDEATYAALADGASAALCNGGVIVDATFRAQARRREIAVVAEQAGARLIIAECHLPAAELERRARAREHDGSSVSDATAEIALEQLEAWRPWDVASPGCHVHVRTDASLEHQVNVVADGVDAAREAVSPLPAAARIT